MVAVSTGTFLAYFDVTGEADSSYEAICNAAGACVADVKKRM
jgi:hypothetical protein